MSWRLVGTAPARKRDDKKKEAKKERKRERRCEKCEDDMRRCEDVKMIFVDVKLRRGKDDMCTCHEERM